MTDSKGRPVDSEDASQSAPKSPGKFKSSLTADEQIWIDAEDFPLSVPRDRSPMVQNLRFPRSLDPSLVPEPPQPIGGRRSFGVLALAGLLSVVAGATVMMWGHDGERPGAGGGGDRTSTMSRLSALVAGDSHRADETAPHLVVTTAPPALSLDQATTLGLAVDGAADGAQLVIGGFAPGSAFSVGRAIGQTAWSIPASQVKTATLAPPRGFAGVMDVAVTLMLANGSLADRKTLHLGWLPETSALQSGGPSFSRRLDAAELDALVAHGNALVATGDLAGARLLYQRAAESGNARAALTLAETYDPIVLETLGEAGLAPNVAIARAWYRKARELGAAEAQARLERLEHRSE